MTNLIIAIIAFPVGVICGLALMACFIVAKRADKERKVHILIDETSKELGKEINGTLNRQFAEMLRYGKTTPPDNYCGEEPISNNPNHMDNGGFEGFM